MISSKVISDIRPIFGFNVNEKPKAAVIVHQLHLHYHQGDEKEMHKDIYMALDNDDLQNLKETIERAQLKTKILHLMISQSNMISL